MCISNGEYIYFFFKVVRYFIISKNNFYGFVTSNLNRNQQCFIDCLIILNTTIISLALFISDDIIFTVLMNKSR